jgi:hypothetical protein
MDYLISQAGSLYKLFAEYDATTLIVSRLRCENTMVNSITFNIHDELTGTDFPVTFAPNQTSYYDAWVGLFDVRVGPSGLQRFKGGAWHDLLFSVGGTAPATAPPGRRRSG